MKLIVLGASGGTGTEIVRQAIDRGHSITAFVRQADRLQQFAHRITVKQGDLLNAAELEHVIQGHDAVLSAFGPRLPIAKSDANLLSNFAIALTTAMHKAGVKRLVIESTAFLFTNSFIPPAHLVGRLFFPGVVKDAASMERTLKESELNWTIVRPPRLTDKPHTGTYRVREGRLPRFGFSISRADVADCMHKTLEDRATIGKILGASH